MEGLFKFTVSTAKTGSRQDDDAVDRLNYKYAAGLLVIFGVLVSTATYVGDTIQCWQIKELADRMDYVKATCYISNTYFVPFTDGIPAAPAMSHKVQEREEMEINYYQWVHVVLFLMAFLFFIPIFVWRSLNDCSGFHTHNILKALLSKDLLDRDKRQNTCHNVETQIGRDAGDKRWSLRKGYLTQRYMYMLYLFIKLLFITNVVGQLFILNRFLQNRQGGLYGLDLLKNITTNHHVWRDSGVFPRVTMCDFLIRVLGNIHRYTVQCVLPINMFHEKIFIFVWFMLAVLLFVNTISLVEWIFRNMLEAQREAFIVRYLMPNRLYNPDKDRRLMEKFLRKNLGVDGVFLIRLIRLNAGDIIAEELVHMLWKRHRSKLAAVDRLLTHQKSTH